MPEAYRGPLERVDDCRWRIPASYRSDMRVDGIIYADDALIELIRRDRSPEQVANVATLPGIVGHSLAMPDIHWGYGFCIGGVACLQAHLAAPRRTRAGPGPARTRLF